MKSGDIFINFGVQKLAEKEKKTEFLHLFACYDKFFAFYDNNYMQKKLYLCNGF